MWGEQRYSSTHSWPGQWVEVSGQFQALAALTQWKNPWYWVGIRVSLDVCIKAKSVAGVSDHQMVFLHMFIFCAIFLYPCISSGLVCVHFSNLKGLAQLISHIRLTVIVRLYRYMNTGIHIVSWKIYYFLSHSFQASTHSIFSFFLSFDGRVFAECEIN